MRDYRARLRPRAVAPTIPLPTDDPAGAIAEWSAAYLRIPPGHPRAGEAMELPDYGIAFLTAALDEGIREALLCLGRKNAKSAIIAIWP